MYIYIYITISAKLEGIIGQKQRNHQHRFGQF